MKRWLVGLILLTAAAARGEPIELTLESLQANFRTPEWLQDAKLQRHAIEIYSLQVAPQARESR